MQVPGPFSAQPLFHRALILDLVASSATALLLLAGATGLAPLFGLPVALLRGAGLALLPFLLLLAFVLRAPRPSRYAVWSVIEINLVWVCASFWLLWRGGVAPTALGSAFVVAQALAVLGFALLQFVGWRRLNAAGTGPAPVATRA